MGARIAEATSLGGMKIVTAMDKDDRPFGLDTRPELAGVFTKDSEVFWAQETDLVAIATTAPSHVPLLEEGIRRGNRRFLVEKPFATSVEEGERAVRLAEKSGARVIVNHGRRYCPTYARLAKLDGSAEMGSLRAGVITMGGGAFGCIGVHYFDLLNMLFGATPESVFAHLTEPIGENPRGESYNDPGGSALLLYPHGRRAFIDLADDVGNPGRMEFIFSLGRVIIESETRDWRILRRREEDQVVPLSRYLCQQVETVMKNPRPFDVIEDSLNALKDVLRDDPPICGADKGLDALQVFAAIRWAGKIGQTVSFPLPKEAVEQCYPIP